MKAKHLINFLSTVLLISIIFSVNEFLMVYTQPSVELKVTRVVWGTDPNEPIKAYPGDTASPLTVEAQNFSPNETIKGVKAVLILKDSPFTDVYGFSNATASGEPVVGDILEPTDEILPRGLFTLTFNLDIDPYAFPGTYNLVMIVDYSVNSTGIYVEGEPQTLGVSFVLSKISSTISCSVSPTNIEKGETVDVSGFIEPIQSNATITLSYTRPNASTFNRKLQTLADGSYREAYQPDLEGVWIVNASWIGDERHKGDWATASFEVMFPVSLSIDVTDIYLIGDQEKFLNITISNNGEVLISTIDVTLEIPSSPTYPSPLVIRGDNHWSFKFLNPGDYTLIPVTIYAPRSAIGSTYIASLDLSYRDDYGQSHSETYNLGFVVKGWIDLIIYEKTASPQPVNPGSDITITATILNRGNVAAMFTNATIISSPILVLSSESKTYVGEVDENSAVPFTVLARMKKDLEDGTYQVIVNVSYRDDQYRDHMISFTLNLVVEATHIDQNSQTGGLELLTIILELKWTLLTLIGASIVILILYRRRFSTRTTLKSFQHSSARNVQG